ncbi:Dam family site-specific DNA-(adenine-N6)-methyltransferase [Actinotignum schaalii]|uniref:Dam family site-specific DNA-(adenine-N6)-methyltransferase n=1 Tax=Actinotignum schaalii TaxID=59505 RepID=UPI000401DB04|nr:Dam family site-specific DNA-(adenine-N6)-methyltransferase [Actinotignum schaalii]WQN44994.1 Dam family site-specific DNA-(adenine-N6)-methyltransferase [Actinotignum schaalii]
MADNLIPLEAIPEHSSQARPLLKWAGGKTQLLPELLERMPTDYGKYIEPFFGGGALFFASRPQRAIIGDINPELINLYNAVKDDVHSVIEALKLHRNDEDYFYTVRAQNWEELPSTVAAARTIFLNRTCFNGLYRVNRSGQFNVPYGRYKNPKIVDEHNLYEVSSALQGAEIIQGTYEDILQANAEPGDFVFLDPPYLPTSKYSDFKRYTKEQFYEEDHLQLAQEIKRLHELGCFVILTNSNHPLVHQLFDGFHIDVVQTKRSISAKASSRYGEDVIVTIPPKRKVNLEACREPLDKQTLAFPSTRYMGSKKKLLSDIWAVAEQFDYENVVDLFSGSGVVSYMFKAKGKSVLANDYMAFSANSAKALIENSEVILPLDKACRLVETDFKTDGFVSETFHDLYYSDEDNAFIDSMRAGIKTIKNPYERSIAMAALIRACLKKRPRGIFTYVGMRYDDGRKDLQMSFQEHFLRAVQEINSAIFDNGKQSLSRRGDAMTVRAVPNSLTYIDPPYYSLRSDNEYVRRYHFVEGLARDWKGVEIQESTQTKKFKSYPTPFASRKGAYDAFDRLFHQHRNSILLVSYSSNSLPTLDEMVEIMSKHKRNVEVLPINYKYSFGNQHARVGNNRNSVQEYLFVGY